jgi:Protein of unknown function (DUF2971)
VRVYHFVNEQFGLEDIRLRRLKIARINELNDPFEWLPVEASNLAFRQTFQAIKDQQANSKGILCFSKTWRNPVQWSHYADRHRGICMGFDIPDRLLKEVSYLPSRLQFDLPRMQNDPEFAKDFMDRVISSKFTHWRYEKEMRSFVSLDPTTAQNGLYFIDFSADISLTEVIVGSTSSITRSQLGGALGNLARDVKCRKARLAFKSFKVVEQRKASLWT